LARLASYSVVIGEIAAALAGGADVRQVFYCQRAGAAAMPRPTPAEQEAAVAACVPVAVGTAYECLFTAGQRTEGQTVRSQAGAGGVGMAAIQLAKRAGATVISAFRVSGDVRLTRVCVSSDWG